MGGKDMLGVHDSPTAKNIFPKQAIVQREPLPMGT
jgi:hypothetical protein